MTWNWQYIALGSIISAIVVKALNDYFTYIETINYVVSLFLKKKKMS